MVLSAAQQRTLQVVCDTLVPGSDPRLPEQVVEAIAISGDPADLAQFGQALTLLEGPWASLLLEGRAGRFSSLDRGAREAALRRWATHPIPALRQAFQAFKRLSGFLHNASADNPLWSTWGYAGQSHEPAAKPMLQVEPLRPHETSLEADVVIVGSGAGGGVAAAELASRGLQVIVLEKGGYFSEPELGMREIEGMQKLYLDQGTCATRDLSVAILAGSAVGGGTLVNWTASFAPPMWLREEWEREHGLTGLSSPAFQECVDDVTTRLGVNTDQSSSLPSSSAGRLMDGCRLLGYNCAEIPRNAMGCGDDCGYCTFGCRTGAKQSTTRTYLVDAVAHGARVIPGADVRRVIIEAGRVTGLETIIDGRQIVVRAPRIVLAAGAIGSPAILLRSGLDHPWLGRNLHLHPVTAVAGVYDEPVNAWSGRLLPAYSNQFARVDGNYGFLLEVAPTHPGLGALGTPWESGEQYQRDLAEMNRLGVFLVLVRDKDGGRVSVDRNGRHRIDYRVSPYDMAHMLQGQQEAIRVHTAAGARRIITLHSRLNDLSSPTPESAEAFAVRSARLPHGPNQLTVLSAHQMGTCRMGRSHKTAVADASGQVFGVRGLYVADASAFPAASGVNPMITVMSLARWIVKQMD